MADDPVAHARRLVALGRQAEAVEVLRAAGVTSPDEIARLARPEARGRGDLAGTVAGVYAGAAVVGFGLWVILGFANDPCLPFCASNGDGGFHVWAARLGVAAAGVYAAALVTTLAAWKRRRALALAACGIAVAAVLGADVGTFVAGLATSPGGTCDCG